ncbi:type I polyketide synthase [Puniceibacterium sediminis]|uniref:Enediyne polyketide synthase n=1 Tax=Puniceibacterium sediminis TaxID=1608407 RepID=A0A238Z4R4_9RHOB|nr:type I polyketide synthase [Puniceibacterium sediminis]SNR77823.1 enediyne polyketide synthase [Puniceibacterium sediminis]
MTNRIAILSTACRYAEAPSPDALWQNVLDGRRSFRAIPPQRLALGDYAVEHIGTEDSIPRIYAGLISDWQFRRDRLCIPKSTFDTADLTHWLALETAMTAVGAVGGAEALPRGRTAVILGNTLTGEFSRAAQMRLRLPYLKRHLSQALQAGQIAPDLIDEVTSTFAANLAQDFPDPNEESLAGALANTIAGRIANQLDLGGGAWTVDGACAASLLAFSEACSHIVQGDLDVAIVGGVDLSLDPFELVGFARTGALCRDEMRVFDKRSSGFWPGEGCGIAVLASEEAAQKLGGDPLAWVAGWGCSTDGAGGLTRPTAPGQSRAIARAWARAGHAPAEAAYFEAHGTGTAIGDPTEITALAEVIGQDGAAIPVGSIKANIGHCKAAAGIAGVIKTTQALKNGIIPPHISCAVPHPIFAESGGRLCPAQVGEFRSDTRLAGVSAFGFGGINAHLVLAGPDSKIRHAKRVSVPAQPLAQEAELFIFAAQSAEELHQAMNALLKRAPSLSHSEMADAAAGCFRDAVPQAAFRAAIVADRPEALQEALTKALSIPPAPVRSPPRIGFVFPGQAAPVRASGGAWTRRFPSLPHTLATFPSDASVSTEHAQPAIAASALMGLDVLTQAGIMAEIAAGHSLGEITALHWAGALPRQEMSDLVQTRGQLMARHGEAGGTMLQVTASAQEIAALGRPDDLEVACLNGARDVVLAGPQETAVRWMQKARAAGLSCELLKVSHAFHSAAMAQVETPLAAALQDVPWSAPQMPVISTVTGAPIEASSDLSAILTQQLCAPVRFSEVCAQLAQHCDLVIEVGPGKGLSRLARDAGLQVASPDVGAETLFGLLDTLATVWRLGGRLDLGLLFADRAIRPLGPAPELLRNPCGVSDKAPPPSAVKPKIAAAALQDINARPAHTSAAPTLDIVCKATAEALGLPLSLVKPEARLLEDLHLNSLSVGRIVKAAAQALGLRQPALATDVAAETVYGLARLLDELLEFAPGEDTTPQSIEGVAPWVGEYRSVWQVCDWPKAAAEAPEWCLFGPDPGGIPTANGTKSGLVSLMDVALPDDTAAAHLLWSRVKAARAAGLRKLLILHPGMAVSGFAGALLEDGVFDHITLVDAQGVDGPAREAGISTLLRTEAEPFAQYRCRAAGGLDRAVLEFVPISQCRTRDDTAAGLGPCDTLLVTGGAKGIGAESALRLSKVSGAALLLVGRSSGDDPAVTETLRRAKAQGCRARYLQADVTDASEFRNALETLPEEERPTAFLHAAGVNDPAGFDQLDATALSAALAPKLQGLETLLCALDPQRIRLAIGFGSVIGALGLAGETHYALANAMMSARLMRWGRCHDLRTLALDWSVWAGAGMGERIGAVERLARRGVEAIPLGTALDRLCVLLYAPQSDEHLIVTGRFGQPRTLGFAAQPSLQGRFLETAQIRFPGIELVVDTRLARGSDPWITDHVVEGTAVMPAVLMLEAMAQAAKALTGHAPTGFRDLDLLGAVTLDGDEITLRTAVLRRDDGSLLAAIRASDDGFSADRATVTLSFEPTLDRPEAFDLAANCRIDGALLYRDLCFNSGRFQRVEEIDHLTAFSLRAGLSNLSNASAAPWFGPFESQDMVLGDAGARDAGLHVLQACVPQRRVLPVTVAQIQIADPEARRVSVEAVERASDGNTFVFDVLWRGPDGAIVEYWRGARFRAIAERSIDRLAYPFFPAAMQRAAVLHARRRDIRTAICNSADRQSRRQIVMGALDATEATRRGDGLQMLDGPDALSLSHTASLTFGARGPGVLACDLVETATRDDTPLVRDDSLIAEKLHASGIANAFAAVWAARECARKGGVPAAQPLLPLKGSEPGFQAFRCGAAQILCHAVQNDGCIALMLTPATAKESLA